MSAYAPFAPYYDGLMRKAGYSQRADYLCSLLAHFEHAPGLTLDLACGTGSMTVELAKRGFDIYGTDADAAMLSEAMQKADEAGLSILFLCQKMQQLDLYGTVDTVICTLDGLNHLSGERDLRKTFERVSLFLNPGGYFLFDMNTVHKYRDLMGDTTIAENREEGSFIWDNSFDEEEGLNYYELAVFLPREDGLYEKCEEVHCQKAYPQEEIESLIKEAGMDLLAVYDAYTMEPATKDSERMFFVAREKGKNK